MDFSRGLVSPVMISSFGVGVAMVGMDAGDSGFMGCGKQDPLKFNPRFGFGLNALRNIEPVPQGPLVPLHYDARLLG